MKLSGSIIIFLFMLLATQPVWAAGLRCGQKLVVEGLRIGITQYEVIRDCGIPIARKGNRWIYEFPGRNLNILVFNDAGQLTAIHKR